MVHNSFPESRKVRFAPRQKKFAKILKIFSPSLYRPSRIKNYMVGERIAPEKTENIVGYLSDRFELSYPEDFKHFSDKVFCDRSNY